MLARALRAGQHVPGVLQYGTFGGFGLKIGWGIDVGVASLGFAVIELDAANRPARLIDGVALVYPAPTGGAERTRHKSMRTQYRRRTKRVKALRAELVRLLNLGSRFSDSPPKRNNSRVRLRAKGLEDRLRAGDLARAILHIAKNRGQRLTRGLKEDSKTEAGQQGKNDNDRQKMAETANETKRKLTALGIELGLDGSAHPSQLLMREAGDTGLTRLKKHREGMPVFTRAMAQAELDALLTAQKLHHAALTDEVCEKLRNMVFEEAEAKAPSVGKCRYGVPDADGGIETRLPRGSDLFQRKRIYEEVNNLRLVSSQTAADWPLDMTRRDRLASLLLDGQDLTAARVRKALGLGRGALADMTSLDIRRKGRKTAGELKGHPLAAAMSKADALEQWRGFDEGRREKIANLVRTEDDREVLSAELEALGLQADIVQALSDARLPAAYSAAGATATRKLLAELESEVIPHYKAEQRAGLESIDREPPSLERLPYYGKVLQGWCVGGSAAPGDADEARLGRIPNPVVHVALNQLRKTANDYLKLYGKPARICIELARDLNKSAEERENAEKENLKNRKENEAHIESLGAHKRKLKPEDLKRMRLHRMQSGECLYTGEPICMEHLFDGSVEIDHILPYAATGDDGIANLALAFKEANQFKRKRPPFEAFSSGYKGKDYAHILKRAKKRGGSVYWRFKADAMERYENQDEIERRFLNDTRYIARMAARYLSCVCTDPNGIVSLNGRITSDLRYLWGLRTLVRDIMVEEGRLDAADILPPKGGENLEERQTRLKRADKVRWDHRHHLLDAVVAACTTRSDVQRLQTLAARDTGSESARDILAQVRRADPLFEDVGICWRDGFRGTVKAFLQGRRPAETADRPPATAVIVKADHDPRGQLHEATNYGLICEVHGKPGQYVTRVHVSISEGLDAKQIRTLGVRDNVIRKVERAKERGARFWWGGHDPVSALRNNLARDLEKMRARLLELMKNAPPEALEKARTDGSRQKARAEWAKKQYIADTGRRRFTRVQIVSLRILKGPLDCGKRPRQANPGGGNDRLVYFVDGEGNRDIEIVSTLDANTPGFKERWRCEGGRLLFVLRKNDLVEMAVDSEDPTSKRSIYRMVKFSGAGNPDFEFLPVEEARTAVVVKDPKDPAKLRQVKPPKHVRITSVTAFSDRRPEMILLDSTGRERWRSPRLN